MNGIVKNVQENRGFGFIRGEGGGEYFFHRDDFSGHWHDLIADVKNESVRVEFDPKETPKGPRAHNVARRDWPDTDR